MQTNYDIMIIDDEQVIIDSMIKICRSEGFTIDFASDASIAIDKIKSNSYRLIISDIMMPYMDGFQFLAEIERSGIKAPIIMTTGYSTVENAVKSLTGGAIDFIPKPFDIDEIVSTIHRGLNYSQIVSKLNNNDDSDLIVPCPQNYQRLGYSSWVYKEPEGLIVCGVTDLFLKAIKNILNIELLNPDEYITQGFSCCKINSKDDESHNLISALSGKIILRNDSILTDIDLIQKDPYFNGWIYKIIPNDYETESAILTNC